MLIGGSQVFVILNSPSGITTLISSVSYKITDYISNARKNKAAELACRLTCNQKANLPPPHRSQVAADLLLKQIPMLLQVEFALQRLELVLHGLRLLHFHQNLLLIQWITRRKLSSSRTSTPESMLTSTTWLPCRLPPSPKTTGKFSGTRMPLPEATTL